MNESLYDAKIAPLLHEVGRLCEEHGLPMIAVVEYAPGEFGHTMNQTGAQSMPMTMANLAARSRGNLDAFMLSILKHCRAAGIDTSASIYATLGTSKSRTPSTNAVPPEGGVGATSHLTQRP